MNKAYANHLLQRADPRDVQQSALVDPRFADMFKDEDFVIDFENDAYLHRHPEIKYAMEQLAFVQSTQQDQVPEEEEEEQGDEDDDIRVGDTGETYDDKLLQAKQHTSTLSEDYHQQTRLPTLLHVSDDEDDGWDQGMQEMEQLRTLAEDT